MSAMQPSGALISIGGAVLYTVGLNPQRLSYSSEARFPAHAVQGGMRYQVTGAGDQRMTIEAVTYPHVVGGLDAVAILKGLHRAQLMAPMTRLRGNYLGLADGLCVIETMDYDEERLHPVDGIGREVSVSLGLLFIPPSIYLQSAEVFNHIASSISYNGRSFLRELARQIQLPEALTWARRS